MRSVALILVPAVLAGCSSGAERTGPLSGKQLFQDNCGSCHTLDGAGGGTFGPQLDGTRLPKEAVRAIIKEGPGDMPAGVVDGADADKIAAYVASADG